MSKNDCVYCKHEDGGDGANSMYCHHFKDLISTVPYDPSGGKWQGNRLQWKGLARRDQDYCPGFRLEPTMKRDWEQDYGSR